MYLICPLFYDARRFSFLGNDCNSIDTALNIICIHCFNHHDQSQGYYLDSKSEKIMTCNCENHLEQFTCSGVDCQVCVLGEENYLENPELPEERYCLKCAMKKAGFMMEELWQLMMANPDNSFQCGNKSH